MKINKWHKAPPPGWRGVVPAVMDERVRYAYVRGQHVAMMSMGNGNYDVFLDPAIDILRMKRTTLEKVEDEIVERVGTLRDRCPAHHPPNFPGHSIRWRSETLRNHAKEGTYDVFAVALVDGYELTMRMGLNPVEAVVAVDGEDAFVFGAYQGSATLDLVRHGVFVALDLFWMKQSRDLAWSPDWRHVDFGRSNHGVGFDTLDGSEYFVSMDPEPGTTPWRVHTEMYPNIKGSTITTLPTYDAAKAFAEGWHRAKLAERFLTTTTNIDPAHLTDAAHLFHAVRECNLRRHKEQVSPKTVIQQTLKDDFDPERVAAAFRRELGKTEARFAKADGEAIVGLDKGVGRDSTAVFVIKSDHRRAAAFALFVEKTLPEAERQRIKSAAEAPREGWEAREAEFFRRAWESPSNLAIARAKVEAYALVVRIEAWGFFSKLKD